MADDKYGNGLTEAIHHEHVYTFGWYLPELDQGETLDIWFRHMPPFPITVVPPLVQCKVEPILGQLFEGGSYSSGLEIPVINRNRPSRRQTDVRARINPNINNLGTQIAAAVILDGQVDEDPIVLKGKTNYLFRLTGRIDLATWRLDNPCCSTDLGVAVTVIDEQNYTM